MDINEELILAAKAGNVQVIEQLLNAGANVNHTDLYDMRALVWAAKNGHGKVVAKLITAGADIDYRTFIGNTALMYGAKEGHIQVVEQLLKAGSDVDCVSLFGFTALMYGAKEGHIQVVEQLLKAGANVDYQDKNGYTALMWAAEKGHSEIAKYLAAFINIKTLKRKNAQPISAEITKYFKANEHREIIESNIVKLLVKNESLLTSPILNAKVNKRLKQEFLNALKFGKKVIPYCIKL